MFFRIQWETHPIGNPKSLKYQSYSVIPVANIGLIKESFMEELLKGLKALKGIETPEENQ